MVSGQSVHDVRAAHRRTAGRHLLARSHRTGPDSRQSRPPPRDLWRRVAAACVAAPLDALGSSYLWGGTAANGFDCSGLVQWAYAQHGIRLPRMSRDQARSGSEVTPDVAALQPGDILLFSAQPGGGVTHVGMYVGDE